jgi:GTP-binding protein HflX
LIEVQGIEQKERAWLVGIYGQELPKEEAEQHLDELALLTDTAGAEVLGSTLQKKNSPNPATYLGKGKLSELAGLVKAQDVDVVIFDDDLTPTQVRNIYNKTKTKVLDRSGLILDIFAFRAKTSASKTQVELAQLEYLLPRLTRMWTHLSRQKGGIGTKGPGETQLETDRRLIDRRIGVLKQKLEKLDRQRVTQRKGRTALKRIALVGYTNAGKSTLMNALTQAGVYSQDQLFATLDSTVRKWTAEGKEMLVSDTVGFIRKLPHGLIESFKSTLDEILESDLLLHVVDINNPVFKDYISVVNDTLREIGAEKKPQLLVFNKIDTADTERIREMVNEYPESCLVSAVRGIGLQTLEQEILRRINQDFVTKTTLIPLSDYHKVAFLHEVGEVQGQEVTADGFLVSVEVERNLWDRVLRKYPDLKETAQP